MFQSEHSRAPSASAMIPRTLGTTRSRASPVASNAATSAIVAIDGETSRRALVGESLAAWDATPLGETAIATPAAATASWRAGGARNFPGASTGHYDRRARLLVTPAELT